MSTKLLILGLVVATLGAAKAQPAFTAYAGHASANVDLPAQVNAEAGKITLWADFEHSLLEGILLYLVNRSMSSVSFDSQDGDIYIKLETQTESGEWVRAQTHAYSDCGNSYGSRTLRPGMHYRLLGYRPSQGEDTSIVRFTMQSGQALSSNIGKGRASRLDIESARVDQMSLRGVPQSIRDAFDPEWRRSEVGPLARANALVLLRAYGPVPALKQEAEKQLAAWRSSPPKADEEKQAAVVFERILSSKWPDDVSIPRLMQFCSDQLESKPSSAELPKSMVWRTLSDLATQTVGKRTRGSAQKMDRAHPLEAWKYPLRLAAANLPSATEEVSIGIADLLSIDVLVDSFLKSRELEPLLKGPWQCTKVAARALARRGEYEQLAELAMGLPATCWPPILAALASGGVNYEDTGLDGWGGLRQPEPGTREEALWQKAMSTIPLQVAYALRHLSPHDEGAQAYGPIVHRGLRDFWTVETEKSKNMKEDFPNPEPSYSMRLSVDFLARSKRNEDVELFKALLLYRGYELERGIRGGGTGADMQPYAKQRFGVRQAAIEALKALGEPVPSDVVLERDVSDPAKPVEKTSGEERQ
jgi:hypothetical protein